MSVSGQRMVFAILGMTSNACRERVIEALGRVEGVREVHVNLIRAEAVIESVASCEAIALIRAVEAAGYAVLPQVV